MVFDFNKIYVQLDDFKINVWAMGYKCYCWRNSNILQLQKCASSPSKSALSNFIMWCNIDAEYSVTS